MAFILNENGLTKHELSKITGEDPSVINSYLYSHQDLYKKDNSKLPVWRCVDTSTQKVNISPFYKKFENLSNAKTFSQSFFNSLADWSIGTAFNGRYSYKTKSGNYIFCDSKSEVKMLEHLECNNLVLDLGGQMLEIKYNSPFREKITYFPDIIALTNDRKIAIIEVKPVTAMSYHKNIEKYRALGEYCKKNGFIYVMIDPDENFMTFEELKNIEACACIEYMFYLYREDLKEKKTMVVQFDDSDVNGWYDICGEECTKSDFKKQVHSMIIQHEWYNVFKNGFMVYSRPVKLNNRHKVIDYI